MIPLINGVFHVNHPPDSEIMYGSTVSVDETLRESISDCILIIDRKYIYHMEAQLTSDSRIIYRTYDYGYECAVSKSREPACKREKILNFPESRIIYLYPSRHIPKNHTLHLNYGKQGKFTYRVETIPLINYTLQEILNNGLIGFLPFHLLKMERVLQKTRDKKTINLLHELVINDILGTIERYFQTRKITSKDYISLQQFTRVLFLNSYGKYKEVEPVTETMEGVIKFDWEIMLDKIEQEGLSRGIQKGISQGIEQGISQGIEQGIEQGISQGQQNIINKMRQYGLSEREINEIIETEV